MFFYRKIINTDKLKNIIDFPETLKSQKMEMILLPVDSKNENLTTKNKLKNINNSLIKEESQKWSKLFECSDESN